ncbi:MAG: nuclear transport factor 2 family protein [Colwellia sp.]|nr:nuclear transport factor 2 family protein [Colwellia sp.]
MKNTPVNPDDFAIITGIVNDYFDGLHHGDVAKLTSIFHADAWLKAPGIRRSLQAWLTDVANRPTPKQQGRSFEFKLLSLDIVQDQAMVKIHCPLFNFNYIDYLGLLKENGQWLIVNKMYSDLKEVTG